MRNQNTVVEEFIKKNFMRIFDILADFYMNMESIYISIMKQGLTNRHRKRCNFLIEGSKRESNAVFSVEFLKG